LQSPSRPPLVGQQNWEVVDVNRVSSLDDSLYACNFANCSQLVEISGHLVDLRVVMILQVLKEAGVLGKHEVNGCTLATETTSTADSVDVVLLLQRELVVNNEADLLDIDTSSQKISGNEDTDGAGSELLHDDLTLLLVHLTVHGCNDEILLGHGLLKGIDTTLGVAVNDGLLDVKVGVQVKQDFNLPLGLLNSNIVLMDTVEGKGLLLDQDLGRVAHEMLGQTKNIGRERSREQADLDVGGQELEDVLDLCLEATREHLIGLVKNEELEVVSLQEATAHHIVDAAGGANNDVLALSQLADVLTDNGATDTGVDSESKELANGVNDESNLHRELTRGRDNERLSVVDGRVEALQGADGEGTGLTSSRLCLCNCVLSLDDGEDSLLLDGRRVFETEGVDAAEHFLLESHVVKIINFQFPVRFEKFLFFYSVFVFFHVGKVPEVSLNGGVSVSTT